MDEHEAREPEEPKRGEPRAGEPKPVEPKPVEKVADEVAEANPDPITRREALEQRLMEEGRSEEGEEVGGTTG